jgi:hypothetical protein
MDAQSDRIFPHRLDQSGIYHSVCMNCFETVATSFSLATLVEGERQHRCAEARPRKPPQSERDSQIGQLARTA